MWAVHLGVICLILRAVDSNNNFLEVTIPQGTLKGIFRKSWTGKTFASFTGIPYATPPIGNLRFEAPLPAGPWKGVFDATGYKSECTQDDVAMNITDVTGNEDCLYINIYTPQVRQVTTSLLPVMFYTHGGSLTSGSGSDDFCGPDFLLDEDVVLITYNYRLGALGFISMGDEVLPGNNGLKDQALALKWTKVNVANFGGDPDRITIFGSSSGAASSHFLMLSPLTRGLISGAIMQSGSALAPWAMSSYERAKNKTVALAKSLGCSSTDSKHLVQCLRGINAVDIVQAASKLYEWATSPLMPFRPVVEKKSKNAFLPDSPENIIKSGYAPKIPIIFSSVSEEGIIGAGPILSNQDLMREFNEDFDRLAPLTIDYSDLKDYTSVTEKVRLFYLGNEDVGLENALQAISIFTDYWVLYPIHVSARMHLEYGSKPIYQLLYDYRGAKSYGDLYGDPLRNYGVCHCDELLYIFTTKLYGIYQGSTLERRAVNTMIKLWTNFARTGNPTPNSEFRKWKRTRKENLEYYYIDNNVYSKMVNNTFLSRMSFWDDIMSTHKSHL
ncbi:hypothetical protein RI129_011114 [Pyrocoelia pectoralis]|uniref:Carboxylic ester hydrolase n=1 Tax=Pyrocoelia pectoralis TaxID=417401 RepID=A0AAN7V4U3_9COLE